MKSLMSLDDIFNQKIFRIPDFQRGYAWGEKQLTEFWEDLISLDSKRSHYTGVISIKKVPNSVTENWTDEKWILEQRYAAYYVVDGQQRLTTVSIFLFELVKAVQKLPENKNLDDRDIMLGLENLDQVIQKFIVRSKPKNSDIKTYKFGYEVDNPSFQFLRHKVFEEANPGVINETFYTLNLENAKSFFADNIKRLVDTKGSGVLEDVYQKLTQKFLFNLYELDDNFDVYVAFETMNNRGKQLSDLELLKNRLIYLTTLYSENEAQDDDKENTRNTINRTWGEIYFQLGRNKKHPLGDDEFLRAHWIMYFKYSRQKGNDYIRFLLDDYFSLKKVLSKLEVSTAGIERVVELSDLDVSDDDDALNEIRPKLFPQLSLRDINQYVNSLKEASALWYATFFPFAPHGLLSEDEAIQIDRLNRIKIGYFRPLVMSLLLKTNIGSYERKLLLEKIEKFIFAAFRLSRFQSNSGSSTYYRFARSLYFNEVTTEDIVTKLDEDLLPTMDDNGVFKTSLFRDFISRKFGPNGEGFYAWNDLTYLLYEYEESLKASRGQKRIAEWPNFIKSDGDKISIEHIYPQTATDQYWLERFSGFSDQELRYLRGSLGNLLPLSQSINASLQNDSFDLKREPKLENGVIIRHGYSNGSYSEQEVAKLPSWTAEAIKKRGLDLLGFVETRWGINFGSEENKLDILHLSFLKKVNLDVLEA